MEAYEDNIKELTKIYREKLPPELYTDLDCQRFALYYDWLMDEWDALWYMVKMPGCTIFEALVHIHPEKSTIELAKTQERLSYACDNLKELGFTMESLSNDALYQGTKATATIFDLHSGHSDAQKKYMKSVYRRRITALLGKPYDYMMGNANEIAHIAESLPDLISNVMTVCYSDETYTIPMSIQSRLILEDQETDNASSLLEKIKYMVLLKDRAKDKQEPYDRFDNYQAVRSAIESCIIRRYNPEYFVLSHIPSHLYKLFTAKVNEETRKIEVNLTPFGKNIYELII